MNKPTIFFSHSPLDKDFLLRLKEKVVSITGGAVEIFQSSDGQSIPLGRNWVYELEQALSRTKIMFVFLTPNSVNSRWIYFESGHVYSKGIDVVPVALNGIDLNDVKPPLSLLQGFNINSHMAMNNIIHKINEKFSFSFSKSFSPEDFTSIISSNSPTELSIFKELSAFVDSVSFSIATKENVSIESIESFFEKKSISFQKFEKYIVTHGLEVAIGEKKSLDFQIDPSITKHSFPLIDDMVAEFALDSNLMVGITISFFPSIKMVNEKHKITAKFLGSEVSIVPKSNCFQFKELNFILREYTPPATGYVLQTTRIMWSEHVYQPAVTIPPGPIEIYLEFKNKKFQDLPLYELLQIAFERNVLYKIA